MLSSLLICQHGAISASQAAGAGLSEGAVWRRISAGEWERLLPGVYRVAGSPPSWLQLVIGACLWGGDEAAASHSSAGAVLRLRGCEPCAPVHIVTTKRLSKVPEWLKVHRLTAPLSGTGRVSGIPVTPPWRTLLDLGSVTEATSVERALDDALRQGMVSLPQLAWAIETYGKRNHRGTSTLRCLLEDRDTHLAPPESDLERLLYRLVASSDLPPAVRQHRIWDGTRHRRLDLAWVEQRVDVEADGKSSHLDARAFQDDRDRDVALRVLGWTVLRFTWDDITVRPGYVLGAIRATLARFPR